MSDDPLKAIEELRTLHKDDLEILRSLVEAPDTVTIPRAQLEAYRTAADAGDHLAAAEALYRKTHDLEGEASPKTGRAWDLMRREGDKMRKALAALRAAGIEQEETNGT